MDKNNERFLTKNNILMLKTQILNWRICKRYATKSIPNPEFYVINIGDIGDMWQATLIPETMILSFSSLHYSNDSVYRFEVNSIDDASNIVLKFIKGMNQLNNIIDTIYYPS